MIRMTTEEIMSWRPCYDEQRVADLVGDGITLADGRASTPHALPRLRCR